MNINMTHIRYEYQHDSFTIWNHIYCQRIVHRSQNWMCGGIHESYFRIKLWMLEWTYIATRCNTLQHYIVNLSTMLYWTYTATRCNTLQHYIVNLSTMLYWRYTATRCNTLQHYIVNLSTMLYCV